MEGDLFRLALRLTICLVAPLSLVAAAPPSAGPVAMTRSGRVEGIDQGAVHAFLGIPFAAPPVGPGRWRAPRPVAAWSGVRSARNFGASCWQGVTPEGFGPWSPEYVVQGDVSEDCLFLNVWAPAAGKARRRPVLVWIHGGGFNSGSGAIPIYDGGALAARGIVVVTINYRVNVFGFLAHPGLSAEAGAGPAANFGLQDMIAALYWVRDNVSAFGGDPGQVTIAGQSAGAMAVHALIAAPSARGLFQRAIAQSGFPRPLPLPDLAEAEKEGLAFGAEKKAPSLAALRALPAEALQSSRGANSGRFGPVIDGRLLPQPLVEALRSGRGAAVPMLAGFTADEGSGLSSTYGSPDPGMLRQLREDLFGPRAASAAALYRDATEADRVESNIQLHRDRWAWLLQAWATATNGRAPLYGYRFTRVAPGPQSERWRAFHSSEIPYVFGTLDAAPERGFTAEDRAFSARIAGYWLNFIATGNPNGADLPAWPPLRIDDPLVMRLGEPLAPEPLLAPEKRALLRTDMRTKK